MIAAAIVALFFAALSWATVGALERWLDRVRQRAMRAALGEPHRQRGATGLVATLEGHLADDAPTITSFHPRGTAFLEEANAYALTDRRTDRALVVDLDAGHRAVIEGDVQVLIGSLESEHDAPLAAAVAFEAGALVEHESTRKRTGQFRQVKAGDRVRVRGTIEPAPDDDARYREGSRVVRVRPASGAVFDVVAIASTERTTRRRTRLAPAAWVTLATAFAIVGPVTLFALPAQVKKRASAPQAAPTNACRATVLERIAHDDTTGAVFALERCDDAYARGMEAFARGAFGEASNAFARALESEPDLPPSLTETEVHLFAHEHARAAAASRRMVERFYPGPSTAEKRYLECITGLLDDLAKSGPADAGRAKPQHPKACSEMARGAAWRENPKDDGHPPACLTCGASNYLRHLIDRRTVARQLGGTIEPALLGPIIARFVDAQTDVTIASELDELETFHARAR